MKTTFLTYVFYSATVAFGSINTSSTEDSGRLINVINPIELYFKNFETLTKLEDWKEIITQGKTALAFAKNANRLQDEAKICAQLASIAFYSGEYIQVLIYANRCHELSKSFIDPTLFIRSLCLESAVYRAFAAKEKEELAQQISYLRAVETAEEAAHIYFKNNIDNAKAKGEIYFNLGAAHADNPKGDLEKAIDSYFIALECFKKTNAINDALRINIRLGKVYLLQKKYDLSQKIIDEVRSQISNERLAMHTDYLEAQLKLAINDLENARETAENGLARAKILGAKEDELRLTLLLQIIQNLT
ncbi:MAG: hypothetical protein C5B45_00800 [Chlamydiae bacterium]|nr:MAG: hypothetical protein C5B45_00800 [Chlamydiota bacterium]